MLSQLDARRGVVLDVGDTPQPVRRALIFIDEHAGEPITPNELALAGRTATIVTGQYVDPRSGRITFREYAERWRATQVHRLRRVVHVDRQLVTVTGRHGLSSDAAFLCQLVDQAWRECQDGASVARSCVGERDA